MKGKRLGGLLLYICITMMVGCGSSGNPDVYHVGVHKWVDDSIYVRVFESALPLTHPTLPGMTIDCLSCNLTNPKQELIFNDSGVARVYIPETPQLISARLHLHGNGIDTTFLQKQRPPNEAAAYFHLSKPLIGRVLVDRFALLYSDTTQNSIVTSANVGDELNIYGEQSAFYSIHHPNFDKPLFLLKDNAVRLR
jgi:hypothetical protein